MKNFLRQNLILLVAGVLVIGGVILAGELTPITGSPEVTYVSLNDIYDKLTTGATTTEKSFNPETGPSTSTMHTLSEIFEAVPEWLTLDNSTTTVSAGYYETTDLATVDTDLTATNIASGTAIFGVEGSYEGGGGVELHTGQTTSYVTGDDASTDGTAKSMTRTEPVSGEGIVTDAQTGLIWQDGDNGQTDTWANSITYCNNLNWGGYATGWRLPNKLEWETVMVNERNDWNKWPAVFQSRATYYYWTSTTLSSSSDNAYYVNMYIGVVDNDGKTDVRNNYARCVRDQ